MLYFFSTHKRLALILLLLFLVNIFTYVFVWLKLPFAPELIPLWYSMPKGEKILSSPNNLYAIPVLMTWIFLCLNLISSKFIKTQKQLVYPFFTFAVVSNIYLLWSLYIISDSFLFLAPSIISPEYKSLITPFIVTFAISYFITPLSIKFIKLIGAVDDPKKHKHPAMLIKTSVPRGGSIPFLLAFIIGTAIFIGFPKKVLGIVIGAIIAGVVAVIDDKYDLNRNVRLLVLLPIAILAIIGFGVGFFFFNNPFGGTVQLDSIIIPINFIGTHHIVLLADLFTFFWFLWVANMINWSSGVDGQFAGVAGITALVIGLISIKIVKIEPEQFETAMLAVITAGAILGLAPYTWHPQKLMWGFGTTAVGLIIASLSILTNAKVATAVLILLVPTLDAVLVMIRRIMQKRMPTWGDRAHLHHYLLDKKGWSIPQIATFYWGITLCTGSLALFTAGKSKLLALLLVGGVVAFVLSVVHYGFFKDWKKANGK